MAKKEQIFRKYSAEFKIGVIMDMREHHLGYRETARKYDLVRQSETAAASHFASLMTCNDKENMENFTGDSFRDLTRIARINDLMWSELFIENKSALLEQMNLFIDKFNELKTMLETEDIESMRKMMRHSTERRALFDKK